MFRRLLYKAKVKNHKRLLRGRVRMKQFVEPMQVKQCLLLRSTRRDNSSYVDVLKNAFPHIEFVELWHVSTGTLPPSDPNAVTISKHNLIKSGYKGADSAVELLNKQFDWYIDLSNDNSELAELLLLESMAKCKISWRYLGDFVADITVKDLKSRKEFVGGIKNLFVTLSTKVNGKEII
ncbi:MAG: hypothetical protein E7071_07325 [Bacteroidales bacterium]|nr:hypothetical protein [Bacteroidales bacterium]